MILVDALPIGIPFKQRNCGMPRRQQCPGDLPVLQCGVQSRRVTTGDVGGTQRETHHRTAWCDCPRMVQRP